MFDDLASEGEGSAEVNEVMQHATPCHRRDPRGEYSACGLAAPLSGASGHEAVPCRTLNISRFGAYCLMPQPVDRFGRLSVTLELPSFGPDADEMPTRAVRCEATVVRVEDRTAEAGEPCYGVALYFRAMTAQDRDTINQYVAECEA